MAKKKKLMYDATTGQFSTDEGSKKSTSTLMYDATTGTFTDTTPKQEIKTAEPTIKTTQQEETKVEPIKTFDFSADEGKSQQTTQNQQKNTKKISLTDEDLKKINFLRKFEGKESLKRTDLTEEEQKKVEALQKINENNKSPLYDIANAGASLGKGIINFGEDVYDTLLQAGSSKYNPGMYLADDTRSIGDKALDFVKVLAGDFLNVMTPGNVGDVLVNSAYNENKAAIDSKQAIARELIEDTPADTFINETLGYGKKLDNGKTVQETLDENASLIKSTNMGGKVLESIGRQLPSMVIGAGSGELGSLGTMAISAYGSGVEEAYKNGATREEANRYGLMTATIEVATEKMFAGAGGLIGKGALDDVVKDALTSKIKNKVANYLVNYGLDMLGEGTEEVLADIFNPLAKKLSYASEEDLMKLYEDENFLEDFLMGMFSAGVMKTTAIPFETKAIIADSIKNKNVNYQNLENTTQKTNTQEQIEEKPTEVQENVPKQNVFEENNKTLYQDQTTKITPLNEVNQELQETRQSDIANQVQAMNLNKAEQTIKTNNLNEYLEDVATREAQQNQLDKESVRQILEDYIEENNLENPTKEDLMNAFDDYDAMDTAEDINDIRKAEQLYEEVADEIIQENNKPKDTINKEIRQEVKQEQQKQEIKQENLKENIKKSLLTQQEQNELEGLREIYEKGLAEEQELNRIKELERKEKGITIKYPELKTNNTFNDIKQAYYKYNNEISTENKKILNKAKNIIEANKQGRRTIDEWKQVAEFIGSNANVKNAQDLQRLAIETWFETRPNAAQNLNRQGKKFVPFAVQDWVNSVYKGAGVGQEVNIENNNNVEYNEIGDINGENKNNRRNVRKSIERRESSKVSDDAYRKNEKTISKEIYEQHKQYAKENRKTDYNKFEQQIVKTIKNDYNRDTIIFNDNENNNLPFAFVDNKNPKTIFVSNKISQKNANFILAHENMEATILENKEYRKQYLIPLFEMMTKDSNFNNIYDYFAENGDLVSKNATEDNKLLVAKDVFCDYYAKIKTGQEMGYEEYLNPQLEKIMKENIEELNNSSFSNEKNTINEVKQDNVIKVKDNNKTVELKPKKDGIYENITKTDDIFPKNKEFKVGDKNVSNFYSNITEKSKFITLENRIKLMDNDNLHYYDAITNKETLQNAMDNLNKNTENVVGDFLTKEKFTPTDVATGWILVKRYQDAGNYDAMSKVIEKMREQGTKAGQTVQMYGILQRLTPEGMEYYAQNQLDKAYNEYSKNKSKKQIEKYAKDFTLTAEEHQFIKDTMEKVQELTDEDAKKVEVAKVVAMLSDKLPPTKGQRLKAWMRLSMLGNPKTQVRNIMGNAIIQPVNWVGDIFAATADKLIAKKTGQRTKGLTDFKELRKGRNQGFKESIRDYKLGIDTRDINLDRFEENIGAKPFYEHHTGKGAKILNKTAKVLNKSNQLLGAVMSGGDRIFSQAIYNNSLQNQMKLNNVEVPTQEMIDIAEQEALSRTWNDSNEYTKAVLQIRSAMNKLNVKGYGLGDVLVPFAKTPANLTKAIVDYSPIGLTKTILKDGRNLKNSLENGQYNAQLQHKFADSLGKGFAGSLLYVAAYALAKSGIITGKSDDDKDVANFMRNTLGIQPYSVKIGDKSFTYDWAQPIAAPFAIVSDIVNQKEKTKDKQDLLTYMKAAGNTGLNVLLDQSFLSSIKDVFNNYAGPGEGIEQQIQDLPARAVPTFFKQVADLIDSTSRQTYVKGNETEALKNKVQVKLPGLSQDLQSQRDTLGREIQKFGGDDNKLQYAFNVFLNPANTNKGKVSEAAEEIYEVYKATGDKKVMPKQVGYSESIDGKTRNLTAEERNKMQKISGELVEENVKSLVNNSKYKKLSNEDKAAVINDIVNYSYYKAKCEVFDVPMAKTYKTADRQYELGFSIADYYLNKVSK